MPWLLSRRRSCRGDCGLLQLMATVRKRSKTWAGTLMGPCYLFNKLMDTLFTIFACKTTPLKDLQESGAAFTPKPPQHLPSHCRQTDGRWADPCEVASDHCIL